MNKYKRLGKNTLLVFIGNAGSKLIGLVMLPFYTSWLSVEDYGVTDIINVYVSFLVSIVSCCIAESIFIFPKGQKVEKQKQYFSSGIVFVLQAFFVSFLLFGTVDFVSSIYGFSNSFTDYLWLIYGLIFRPSSLAFLIIQFRDSISLRRNSNTSSEIFSSLPLPA